MPSSRDFGIPRPKRRMLEGILSFKSLADTEKCILRLENLRQRFLAASDKEGMAACRFIALQGRKRAEMVSRNPRVSMRKRDEKKEVALWFRIWLETPDVFSEWLALRKQNEEYQRLSADKKS